MQPKRIDWRCPICHIHARVRPDRFPVHCACGFTQERVRLGVGDYVAITLHKMGITKQRYVTLKQRVGLSGGCNCPERQQQLNALGRKVGIG